MLLRLGSRRAAHQPSPVALDGHKLSEFRVGELAQLCRLHHGVGEGLFVLGLCEEGKREREKREICRNFGRGRVCRSIPTSPMACSHSATLSTSLGNVLILPYIPAARMGHVEGAQRVE